MERARLIMNPNPVEMTSPMAETRSRQARARPAPRVFVLGNFVQACCWRVPRLPQPGETLEAEGLLVEPGGKGLNVAVGLRRLGAHVDTLIGCGDDAAGDALLGLLAREGIATGHVHRFAGPSGWGAGLIGPGGQSLIAVYRGANAALTARHASAAAAQLRAARLVYGQFETSLPAVEAAFALAHAAGAMTVLNPSPWQPPAAGLRQTTHTLIVNQVEAAQLLGLPDALAGDAVAAARHVRAGLAALQAAWSSLGRLVVTLGEQGSLGYERVYGAGDDEAARWRGWHAPAPRVRAVDTVGAGDAFASGYCAAVLAGEPLPAALLWGNLCGAHVARQRGVLQALPGPARLRARLQRAGPLAAGATPV